MKSVEKERAFDLLMKMDDEAVDLYWRKFPAPIEWDLQAPSAARRQIKHLCRYALLKASQLK